MFDDFFALPYGIVLAVLVMLAVGVSCGLHVVVHRTVPYEKLVEHNDVAGFMIAVVGVLYSVLIAFVVVVVWQQYNESDANYGNEVATAADVYVFAGLLPPPRGRAIQRSLDAYIVEMIDQEWPAMRTGGVSPAVTASLAELERNIRAVVPRGAAENDARTHVLNAAQRLFDLRNRRLSDNSETLPPVLWAALLLGAVITVAFGYLFGVKTFGNHLIMTGSVAALIAIMFTLLIELDFPFRRDTALSVFRWTELQRDLHVDRDGAMVPGSDRRSTAV